MADVRESGRPVEVKHEALDGVLAAGQGEGVAIADVDAWVRQGELVPCASAPQVEGAGAAGEPEASGGLVADEGAELRVLAEVVGCGLVSCGSTWGSLQGGP